MRCVPPRRGQGSVFARIHDRSTAGSSIVSRLHSRSITGQKLLIQVHQHFGRQLHLVWEYGSTGRHEVCAERIFEMTDELYTFCKQLKEGGIERLCDCVLKGVVCPFDYKIYTMFFRFPPQDYPVQGNGASAGDTPRQRNVTTRNDSRLTISWSFLRDCQEANITYRCRCRISSSYSLV
jgi:hypothetical protein